MNADLIRRLSDADPIAALTREDESQREALHEAVVSGGVRPRLQIPAPRPRRRLVLALAVIAGLLLLAGSAYAANAVLDDPPTPPMVATDAQMDDDQVQSEYELWQQKLRLPPGVEWHVLQRIPHVGYGGGEGALRAYEQALAEWCAEWIGAAEAGDEARVATAIAELARIRRAMPVAHGDGGEGRMQQGGWEANYLHMLDEAIATAKEGDFRLLRSITDGAEQPPLALEEWCAEWIAAAAARDQARVSLAITELARIRATMPIAVTGAGANLTGYEELVFIAGFDEAVAAAKQGDFTLLRRFAGSPE
jgi:hypothetical protein